MTTTTQLRPYQHDAVESVFAYWARGGPGSPLVEMPTGSGKSLTMASVTRRIAQDYGARVLVLAHRKELLAQDANAIRALWPDAPVGIWSAGLGSRQVRQVTVAGVQSVWRKADALGRVDVVIVDEAHLINTDESTTYARLLADLRAINPDLRLVGFTATPYRVGQGMLTDGDGALFDCIAYKTSIRGLISEGYLSPLVPPTRALVQVDTSQARTIAGEWALADLEMAADLDAVNDAVASDVADAILAGGRTSALVFGVSVAHATHLEQALRMRGINARTVVGGTPDRDRILTAFKARELQCITSMDVLCLDEATEILTSDGWVGINDMTMEHSVANWDNGNIFFDRPKLLVRRDRIENEKMVSLTSKKLHARVTSNHRMLYRTGNGKFSIAPALSLVGRCCKVPVSGICAPLDVTPQQPNSISQKKYNALIRARSYVLRTNGMDADEAKREAMSRLDRKLALRFLNPKELSIDECSLIGFWVGDGTVSKKSRYSATQSMVYPKIIEWFDGVISRTGIHYSRHESPERLNGDVRWCFSLGTGSGPQEKSGIFKLTPYLEKHGTKLWSGFNNSQFDAFVHALWMADGFHGQGDMTPKTLSISNTSHRLLSSIQAVAVCRGYRARIRPASAPKNKHHAQLYVLSLTKQAQQTISKARFVVEDNFKQERVWCVTSSTGNIITRRNGTVLVTGNTTGFDAPVTDVLALVRPTKSPGLYVQMAGRGMRRAPGKTDCLFLDYGGNIARHGPITDVTPPARTRRMDGAAPTKMCPQCNAFVPAGALRCVHCDYEFPPPEKTANASASKLDPLGERPADTVHEVGHVAVRAHVSKSSGLTTMRVTYFSPTHLLITSDYVCLEHDGYARQKAVKWWSVFFPDTPCPETVDLGVYYFKAGRMRQITHVTTARDGKYTRVKRVEFGEGFIPATMTPEPQQPQTMSAPEDADIPF